VKRIVLTNSPAHQLNYSPAMRLLHNVRAEGTPSEQF